MLARAARKICVWSLVAAGAGLRARGDIDPLSGIDFAHIGFAGNAPWTGNGQPGDMNIGRGAVGYEYYVGRFEVTTSQWVEFMNAAFDRPAGDQLPHVNAPAVWGAVAAAPNNPGRPRWSVPAGREMFPVGGVSWRTCAMYCNWLCNGKSSAAGAFMNGAYDVSTFHQQGDGYADQLTHNAGARYWIPTQDEYIKAAHYDPNRFGSGQGGYWVGCYTLTHFAVGGPPGTGEANYGFSTPNPFTIPLGSYPAVQSAFGLLDTAGATSEWTEQVFSTLGSELNARASEGSFWASDTNAFLGDTIYAPKLSEVPFYGGFEVGLRIASAVPAPSAVLAGVFALSGQLIRRRSRTCDHGCDRSRRA